MSKEWEEWVLYMERSAERIAGADERLRIDLIEDEMPYLLGYARYLCGVACEKCHGQGKRVYGSTSTWRGGIGGAALTPDVCDSCWGTGRNDKTGPDLRTLYQA